MELHVQRRPQLDVLTRLLLIDDDVIFGAPGGPYWAAYSRQPCRYSFHPPAAFQVPFHCVTTYLIAIDFRYIPFTDSLDTVLSCRGSHAYHWPPVP